MTSFTSLRLGAGALLLCSIALPAVAQQGTTETYTLDPILVRLEQARARANGYEFSPQGLDVPPGGDGGALLASIPGVSFNRMGGHGVDIVIRGQQGNQLNVIDAGSLTYGGCPNRMDPPTSTLAFDRADRIVVSRGYDSVANGAGGSGGTVRLVREAPVFAEGSRVAGSLTLGATSNSMTGEASGSLAVDLGAGFYAELAGSRKRASDYEDGAGREERSAYEQTSGGLTLGYHAEGVDLAFDIENDRAEDVLFAGAGMDSPLSNTWVYRLRGGVDLNAGVLRRIEGSLYRTEVDHVMDNYSLRRNTGMLMRVPTTSDTTGGTLQAEFDLGRTTAKIGIDHQSNSRMAIAYGGMAAMRARIEAENPMTARFLMWPDVTIAQTGLYAETETSFGDKTKLRAGLRYDHVEASADAAAGLAGYGTPAPNALYTARYGTTFNDTRSEDNLGGLLRLEQELAPGTVLFAGLSRSVRTADANERAMARTDWVGNPDIAPEKHHQLDFGIETVQGNWSLNASAYLDRVQDYILRDQFSVAGVTTYRNVKADLSGVEVSGSWTQGGWEVAGDATWTRGQNRSDDRPLAQIPPLEGKIALSYGQDAWRAGGRVNFATGQDRIDPARDAGKTAGYAVLDLFGSYQLNEGVVLLAGVDNVLDKAYAKHLSRSNTFDKTAARVMEPGRSLYVKLEARF